MKTCPVCKANYSDDNLNFCLNDGAALISELDEQVTQVRSSGAGNQMRVNVQPTIPLTDPIVYRQPPAQPKSNKTAFIVTAIALLLLLLIGGVIAALILIPRPEGKTDISSTTPTPKDDSDKLKEKIANLERQIQEQKKSSPSPMPVSNTAASYPTPLNKSGKVTARVAQSNDGFLALRTEPSVRTGIQLIKIPSGSVVEIEDCQTNYQTIDGRRGRWCMVTYNGKTGWAFDGWLIY